MHIFQFIISQIYNGDLQESHWSQQAIVSFLPTSSAETCIKSASNNKSTEYMNLDSQKEEDG